MPTQRFRRFHGSLLSVAAFFAGLAGCALLVFSGYTIYRNRVARQWPVTDGRVVESRVVLRRVGDPSKGNAKEPRAAVRFAYAVGGRQYVSSNVSYAHGMGATSPVFDPSYAVAFPEGAAVRVAYDPADPAEAVIDVSHDPYGTLAVGAVLAVGFVGYQFWLRRGPTTTPGAATTRAHNEVRSH
jgi:hypothetical protein